MNDRCDIDKTTSERQRMSKCAILYYSSMHVAALPSLLPQYASWEGMTVCLLLHVLTAGFGISLGVHRLMSHRSFETYKVIQYVLAALGACTLQGGPLWWVATHYSHHAWTDAEGDPHSRRDGWFWSHFGWLLQRTPGDVIHDYGKLVPQFYDEVVMQMIDRSGVVLNIVIGVVLYQFGGIGLVYWGVPMRLCLTYHCTWLINSACHTWGYCNHRNSDLSRNLWWVALLTYGEGWHNNHHFSPSSARIGRRWWEFDAMWVVVWIMAHCGLAWNVHVTELTGKVSTRFQRIRAVKT